MNEEFGVLKDMIPACKGVEMHKLAILQAGIEYVRYLQGCVDKLSGSNELPPQQIPAQPREAMDLSEDEEESAPSIVDDRRDSFVTSTTTSAYPSPAIPPTDSRSSRTSFSQQQYHETVQSANTSKPRPKKYSTSPPPLLVQTPAQTGVSPAFNAIQFSPDLSRTVSQAHTHFGSLPKYSPNILPLPQAAMTVPDGSGNEGHAEATATAALMMLTNDRRSASGPSGRGGMSVRDLLSN